MFTFYLYIKFSDNSTSELCCITLPLTDLRHVKNTSTLISNQNIVYSTNILLLVPEETTTTQSLRSCSRKENDGGTRPSFLQALGFRLKPPNARTLCNVRSKMHVANDAFVIKPTMSRTAKSSASSMKRKCPQWRSNYSRVSLGTERRVPPATSSRKGESTPAVLAGVDDTGLRCTTLSADREIPR